jgi:prevent-host-death family protein
MSTVAAPEAEARFSELLDRVERGEQIVITRGGKPAARLVPAEVVAGPTGEKATAADLLAIGREFRALVRGHFTSQDINEVLYDADGLPK